MKKVLNVYFTPITEEGSVVNLRIFIHDITKECELQSQIEDTYFSTIEAFAGLIDAKDDYTGEHSTNVSKYVYRLCKELELDGTGYPDGLRGNEIPLGAQVIAIADSYDAMTSDRVYRKSLGNERAKEILIEEKGTQFNPELVKVFVNKVI
jgi:HD-GYP domain-containing protein (c-di-GMP phosphodiesterase class II)